MYDLAAEGRFSKKRALGESEIVTLQAMKTGALIRFACRAGAILGLADSTALTNIERYGAAIGQAFQIADDLLDVEGDAATLGKAAGKDAAAGKATLVAVLGVDGARAKDRRADRGGRRRAGAIRRQKPILCAPPRVLSPSGAHKAASHGEKHKEHKSKSPAKAPPLLRPLPIRMYHLHAKLAIAAVVGLADRRSYRSPSISARWRASSPDGTSRSWSIWC